MGKRNFVIRRVHSDGTIIIYGKVLAPIKEWLKYDGRFNGLSLVFGLYWKGDELEDFVSLWGTKENYNKVDEFETEEEYEAWCDKEEEDTLGLVEGYYPWVWWCVKEELCLSK